jgi:hypothetical protein
MQVWHRKSVGSNPHSVATWGRRSPDQIPRRTMRPCFPILTASGRSRFLTS